MPNNAKWLILTVIAAVVGAVFGPMLLFLLPGGVGLLVAALMMAAVIGYLIYILAGNKVGRAASPELIAAARSFAPPPGMARLYVVRRGFMGGMAGMKVVIPGVAAGQIRMNQFLMADLPPGTYQLTTEMARNGMKSSLSTGGYTLGPGDIIAVRTGLEMRATHAMTVQQALTPQEGTAEVMSAKMVQWTELPGSGPATPARVVG